MTRGPHASEEKGCIYGKVEGLSCGHRWANCQIEDRDFLSGTKTLTTVNEMGRLLTSATAG